MSELFFSKLLVRGAYLIEKELTLRKGAKINPATPFFTDLSRRLQCVMTQHISPTVGLKTLRRNSFLLKE